MLSPKSSSAKAVFLDRDGTIICQVDALTKSEQMELLPGPAEAISQLNQLGYLCIIVTNQPIIQKGLLSQAAADQLNQLLIKKLKEQGAVIDGVYMCPHSYPSDCRCRKPATGMIEKAQKKFNIDLSKSFIVGDSLRDVATGINAGLKTILIVTERAEDERKFFDVEPDYRAENLLAAIKIIKKLSKK